MKDIGFRVQGVGCRVQGAGCRVQGSALPIGTVPAGTRIGQAGRERERERARERRERETTGNEPLSRIWTTSTPHQPPRLQS